jgi:hypothetical protein
MNQFAILVIDSRRRAANESLNRLAHKNTDRLWPAGTPALESGYKSATTLLATHKIALQMGGDHIRHVETLY